MNNKSSIFTSGEATSENTAFCVHEWNKKRPFTKKVKFFISFLLKNCNNLIYSNTSAFRTETQLFPYPFCVKFDAVSVFTGYGFGCKHSLQLENSSKLRLNKQNSRNLHRYNAYSRLRRPDVTCFHNVNLARLVTCKHAWRNFMSSRIRYSL